ncbi:MAG: hypothetical protein ATN31_05880 [Candidatus Epulonipiscioides saccharophilum]|nr:MAG: hypothetical protein ATN31_05880 [Epulopiscium sp. AS2M-Bin001]
MEEYMKCLELSNKFSPELIGDIIDYLLCERRKKELAFKELIKNRVDLEYSYSWITYLDALADDYYYVEFIEVIFYLLSDADKLVVFRTHHSNNGGYSKAFEALSELNQAKILLLTLNTCSLVSFQTDMNTLAHISNWKLIYSHDWDIREKIILSVTFETRKDLSYIYDFIKDTKDFINQAIMRHPDKAVQSLLNFDAKNTLVTFPILRSIRKVFGENIALLLAYTISGKDEWLDNFCIIGLSMSYRLRHLTIDMKFQNLDTIVAQVPVLRKALEKVASSTCVNKTAIVMYHFPENMYPSIKELDEHWFVNFIIENLRLPIYAKFLKGYTDLSNITPDILNKSSYKYIYDDFAVMPNYFEELLGKYKIIFGSNDIYERLMIIRLLSKCWSYSDLQGLELLSKYNLSSQSIAWFFTCMHPDTCKNSANGINEVSDNINAILDLILSKENILEYLISANARFIQEKKLILILAVNRTRYDDAHWTKTILTES